MIKLFLQINISIVEKCQLQKYTVCCSLANTYTFKVHLMFCRYLDILKKSKPRIKWDSTVKEHTFTYE